MSIIQAVIRLYSVINFIFTFDYKRHCMLGVFPYVKIRCIIFSPDKQCILKNFILAISVNSHISSTFRSILGRFVFLIGNTFHLSLAIF